ncbi:unnamed protein product [Plutella xylostella]|uniref:(diamondback moth) hypothetical protein n=1 Tax=Plutella xylostella TaxID=51655 RepID=A0A8S4E0V7_PLUXY|nr:unnamed protein product [Plutella xylostella]
MIFKTVLGTIKNIKSLLIASDKQLNLNEMNISGKSQCLLKIGAVKNSESVFLCRMKVFILLAIVAAATASSVQVVESNGFQRITVKPSHSSTAKPPRSVDVAPSKIQVVEALPVPDELSGRITVKPSQSSTAKPPRSVDAAPSKIQVVEALPVPDELSGRITAKPSQSSTAKPPRIVEAAPSKVQVVEALPVPDELSGRITVKPSQSSTAKPPRTVNDEPSITVVSGEVEAPERNQILIDIMIRSLIAYLRVVISNGSYIFGIPPLDPLVVEELEFEVPARLINLLLGIEGGLVTGVGGFVVNKSNLRLRTMTFDLDITVPRIYISADRYKLLGDLFTAIPLYGDGEAEFVVENLRLKGLLHLKQSEDEKSILIDWIENPAFELPSLKANLNGVIGGGNIDHIVNAIINEVIVDYVNRFSGAISKTVGGALPRLLNPLLDQIDTWRYIERWV